VLLENHRGKKLVLPKRRGGRRGTRPKLLSHLSDQTLKGKKVLRTCKRRPSKQKKAQQGRQGKGVRGGTFPGWIVNFGLIRTGGWVKLGRRRALWGAKHFGRYVGPRQEST